MELEDVDVVQILIVSVLIFLPLLYELSSTFKYYAKMWLLYVILAFGSLLTIILGLHRWRDPENAKLICWILSYTSKLFGIRAEIRGSENLRLDKPCVVVANHQSSLDLFGMYMNGVWPDRCVPLAKKELRMVPFYGWVAWLTGAIFIDRLNPESAKGTIDATVKVLREQNLKVWVFPEGTRNHDAGLLPFKKGAFHLAITAQVPVCPVVFSSYSEFYSKKEKRFGTGKFTITVLPPIMTDGKTTEDVTELTEQVRKQMLNVYNESSMQRLESNGVN
ncbi:1-acyl-sn-glycerol-3-phosphate acyltransferase alpha-like [Acanthaster planci]|uniref:1-acyl-sn-glycerol-3-phosphate acyltransferase n=1 Tax=Acanthaster planci TaxID=133434 RepID=A0A8B7XWQ5_ACAPL|nr:1-acyl-sn-glycerol-3-phosphate acyltransferase alpha-like [Acanthaster planci]